MQLLSANTEIPLMFCAVIGFFVRFEDDSVESAKTVKQWNVKIISVSRSTKS